MPWNGSGVFNRIYSWVADRDAGLDILADRMDQDTNDIAQGMMQCLTVNGETVPVANLPMNNHRHTGAAVGVADTDYATVGQIKNGGGGITGGFLPLAGGAIAGNLSISGTLAVTGGQTGYFITLTAALRAAAAIITGEVTAASAVLSGNLHAVNSTLSGDLNANDATLSGGLTVAGFTQLHGLNSAYHTITGEMSCVTGDVTGNLSVGGNSALDGNVTITSGGTLNVTGATTLGTLTAGAATFSGQINAQSQINAQNGIRPSVDNGSSCGVSGQAWSQVISHFFGPPSDLALKRDLAPLPPATGLVAAIEPKRFRWKEGSGDQGAGVHWGFIAQEIEGVMAGAGLDFAGVRRENGLRSLDYNELTALLWKAVQELSARVATLEARV